MLDVLGDILKNPAFLREDIESERHLLPSLLEEYNRDPAQFLPDLFRTTAFGGRTLGLPSVAPVEALPSITASKLRDWVKQFVVGNNLVIAAAGVEHQRLLSLVEQYMGDIPEGAPTYRERAVYVGGDLLLPGEPKEHATGLPTTHLLIGAAPFCFFVRSFVRSLARSLTAAALSMQASRRRRSTTRATMVSRCSTLSWAAARTLALAGPARACTRCSTRAS